MAKLEAMVLRFNSLREISAASIHFTGIKAGFGEAKNQRRSDKVP